MNDAIGTQIVAALLNVNKTLGAIHAELSKIASAKGQKSS